MKTRNRTGVRTFVQDSMKRYGGVSKTLPKNALEVHFTKSPPFLDGKAVTVAFERKAVDYYPDARVAVPGSPFFLELVEFARNRGSATRVYTPIVEPAPRDPLDGPVSVDGEVRVDAGEIRNDPHLLFNFAVSYQSVVTSDDLVSIGYDVARESFREPSIIDAIHSLWGETLLDCPGDWPRTPEPDPPSIAPRVLEEVNRRIRKKVAKARRNAQRFLDQEVQSVEDYYRQLVAEERELLSKAGPGSAKDVKDREARIQRYQLDWKRRIQEETRHHQCRVHVRLINWAIVYTPRTQIDFYTGPGEGRKSGTEKTSTHFNHFLGTFDGIVCSETGSERGPWILSADGTWTSASADHLEATDGAPPEGETGETDADA
jgi:hypothetical protein